MRAYRNSLFPTMATIGLEARALSTLGGGVRRYTMEIISRISREQRHDFHVFYDAERFRGTFPGISEHVVPVGHPFFRLAWDYWLLPQALRDLPLDLVHFFKPAMSHRLRVPAIATVYDVIPLLYPETQTWTQRWYWRVQLPLVARTCVHLITISESSKRDIVERLQVSPERITVTPLAVGKEFRAATLEEQERMRQTYRLTDPFLLFVGTIEPRKNLARLMMAFARVARQLPHQLVIAGKWGWRTEDVRRAVRDPRLKGRVRFVAYVPADDLPALYSAADVFVYPSLYEGFGLPPLEALACGTPVVTSNVSSLPEAVGPHALLVSPIDEEALADALVRAVTDAAFRNSVRTAGPRWAAQFTWDRTAQQTLKVYDHVLDVSSSA